MEEYHKIKSLYERDHQTKKLIEGKYTDETVVDYDSTFR